MDPDGYIRGLAAASLADGDPIGWWDTLYRAAGQGVTEVPWDRGGPHRVLAAWADGRDGHGERALVVGCGLGGDAEFVAGLGYATTAFDISPTAVRTAQDRFPGSPVDYVVANLLDLPPGWLDGFDLVVESMTVQALPVALRDTAIAGVRGLVAPGGTLLVIAAAIEPAERIAEGPPWPLTRAEIESFALSPLPGRSLVEHDAVTHRWRAEFRRA